MRGLPLIISIISTLAAKRNFVVLQGCGDDESKACHDSFWEDIRKGLAAELPNLAPADIRCVDSDASERAALADVAASASSGASTNVVAAKLTSGKCCGYCNATTFDGLNYRRAVDAGANIHFLEKGPAFQSARVHVIESNNWLGGWRLGKHFCAVAVSLGGPATVALLQPQAAESHGIDRIEGFVAGVAATCPEAGHVMRYNLTADWSRTVAEQEVAWLLKIDSTVNAFIAANDGMALGAIDAARANRVTGLHGVLVAGYDNGTDIQPYLKDHSAFASVAQQFDKASGGPFFWIKRLIEDDGAFPATLRTDVGLYTSDQQTYILHEKLLKGYARTATPPSSAGPLDVSVQFDLVQISDVDEVQQAFSASVELALTWTDARLAWPPDDWAGTLNNVPAEVLWLPELVLTNFLGDAVVRFADASATLRHDGRVTLTTPISGTWTCRMGKRLESFPYDEQTCGVDVRLLRVDEPVRLRAVLPADRDLGKRRAPNGFRRVELSGGTAAVPSASESPSISPAPTPAVAAPAPVPEATKSVRFTLRLERDPSFYVLAMMLPAFILNCISLSQFWLLTGSKAINVVVLSMLATVGLRALNQNAIGEVVSVLDSFFFTCIVFHFLTFVFCCWEISTEQGDHKHRVGEADKLGRVLVVPAYFAAILGVIGANDTGPEFWCFLALTVAYLVSTVGDARLRRDVTALARSRVRAAPPEAEAPAPSVDTRK